MEDIARRVEQALPPRILDILHDAASLAEERGWKVYLVGGYVRDLLLGRPNYDIDVAVEGDAIALASELWEREGNPEPKAQGRKSRPPADDSAVSTQHSALTTADRFGTAHLEPGRELPGIDLVMARREWYTSPGALPTVEPGDIHDDLARRDFTINALAIAIKGDGTGPLLDPHGGLRDLRDGLIRVLHDDSFIDDPTRIPRAVKYAGRLGFKIEPRTLELARQAVRERAISTVSTDRMVRELLLIMEEKEAGSMLATLEKLGVLRAIHPDLAWPEGESNPTGALRPGDLSPRQRRDAYLAILGARYAGQPGDAERLARSLGLTAGQIRLVREAAALPGIWPRLGQAGLRPSQVYNLLKGLDVNTLQAYTRIGDLAGDEAAMGNLHAYLDTFRHVRPMLDGSYLRELGVEPGPVYSRILGELREARLDGELSERADEEKFVRDLLEKEGFTGET